MPVMKFPVTWVVVADAGSARAYEFKERNAAPAEVPDFSLNAEETHGFSRDIGSDKPGRSFNIADNRRSAIEPHSDLHEQAKQGFARNLSGALSAAHSKGRFEKLVIAAPPKMLGYLRQEMSTGVANAICGEISKDLVKNDAAAIRAQAEKYFSSF